MALGLVIPVVLISQHNVHQAQSEEIDPSLANGVGEQGRTAVVKTGQHSGATVRDIPVAPDNFGIVLAAQTSFAFLRAVQVLHDWIRRRGKRQVVALARSREVMESEKRLEPSPKHILRKNRSPLTYECCQLLRLDLGE